MYSVTIEQFQLVFFFFQVVAVDLVVSLVPYSDKSINNGHELCA